MTRLLLITTFILFSLKSNAQERDAIPLDNKLKSKICDELISEVLKTFNENSPFYYTVQNLPEYRYYSSRAIRWDEDDINYLDTLSMNNKFTFHSIQYFEQKVLDSLKPNVASIYVRIFDTNVYRNNRSVNESPFTFSPNVFGRVAYLNYNLKTKKLKFIDWVKID